MIINTRHRRLTVLHVATINKPIKSDLGYCPIETIIHNIDRGLRSLGHRSIVACSADSRVAGEHYVTIPQSLGDYSQETTSAQRETVNRHLLRVLERAKMGDIDVIHMHEWLSYVYEGIFNPPLPIVMTLHVPAHDSGIEEALQRSSNTRSISPVHFVPISEYQRRQYRGLVNTWKTVHHGIEVNDFPSKQNTDKASYLFTIGRVTRVKGQDQAIELAMKTDSKLIIAGCVQNKRADKEFFEGLKSFIDLVVEVGRHPVGQDYYDRVIKPLLECDKQSIHIGELGSEQKKQWYRHARATLFPIKWGEPFGLVMIESMACGTPILAFNEGAVPEIVVDGKTGFVVDSLSEMIGAIERIDSIDPRECRRHVRDSFSITSMALKYSELYQKIVDDSSVRDTAVAY